MNGHDEATRTIGPSPKTLSGDTDVRDEGLPSSTSTFADTAKAGGSEDTLSHHLANGLKVSDRATRYSQDTIAGSTRSISPIRQSSVASEALVPSGSSAQSSTSRLSDSCATSSNPVAQILTPEVSDGSSSVLDQNTSTVAADLRAALEHSSEQPSSSQQDAGTQSLDISSLPSTHSSSSSASVPPAASVIAAVSAIKSRDFVNSPPPSRPAPSALGAHLAHANPASAASGVKGMASAPAVQTLSTISQNGVSGDSVESLSAAASGRATPTASATNALGRPQPVPSTSSATSIKKPGAPGGSSGATRMPPSLQAKLAAMAARSNNPTAASLGQSGTMSAGERLPTANLLRQSSTSALPGAGMTGPSAGPSAARPGGMMGAPGRIGAMGPMAGRQGSTGAFSGGVPPSAMNGLAKRRPGAGLSLAQMGIQSNDSSSGSSSPAGAGGPPMGRANRPKMQLPPSGAAPTSGGGNAGSGTPFSNFSKIVDPSGSLNFQNKAVLHSKGVDFSNGSSFKINMDELELQDELGSGNYGTVQKVFHKVTKVTMAMKEIRLELDDSKLKAIITELDILHRATAPEIVEFYGAFFIESCVYYCMEFMDAGSLDKFSGFPVPEPVLKRVTASMVRGLKFLKDELQTMHRDVKPTNVLINTAGSVKLCDFGVSGQLERSLAKTNIGCQSYMAPERIKGESLNFLGTYTVSSDVWSLGLSIIEFARGHYPYPPETYSNVFAQLQAIVHGDPPSLQDGYSREADDFVARCLHKDANKRPSYAQLLQHPFLRDEATAEVDMAGWVRDALAYRKQKKLGINGSSSTATTPLSASSPSSASVPG